MMYSSDYMNWLEKDDNLQRLAEHLNLIGGIRWYEFLEEIEEVRLYLDRERYLSNYTQISYEKLSKIMKELKTQN